MQNPVEANEADILRLLLSNPFISLGVGGIVGLYLIGGWLERQDDEKRVIPVFDNADDELAWHEERVAALRRLKQERPTVDDLRAMIREILDDELKVVRDGSE